ncbi:MAG TPA: enoyl-CoA hydratase/isomerase family protein [Acidimicrobiales bacterium]|nr:enoyl-CoA hydratase/isomerase family protein [Acidimicrobiales bacterium]
MAEARVRVERRDDGVAVVTLDHPKVNALSQELLDELGEVFAGLAADLPGAVVVTGGDRLFAAGADVTQFSAGRAGDIAATFHRVLDAVAAFPRATIAAISGYALGGGCELAMACDFRLASEKAVFGQPEILLGIIPGGGGTQRLPRLVGVSRAKELIFSGRQVKADEALAIGLADRVVAPDELHEAALAWAAELAAGPVVAQALAKAAIDGAMTEPEAFAEVFRSDDATIGVQSFLEHGPGQATFTGR